MTESTPFLLLRLNLRALSNHRLVAEWSERQLMLMEEQCIAQVREEMERRGLHL